MCLVLVLLSENPCQQLQALLILSIISTCLQIIGKPQSEAIENKMSLFNELITSVYLYMMMTLTDYNMDSPFRDTFGLLLLGTMLFTFFANIAKVLYQVSLETIKKVNKCKNKKNLVVKLKPAIIQTFRVASIESLST